VIKLKSALTLVTTHYHYSEITSTGSTCLPGGNTLAWFN